MRRRKAITSLIGIVVVAALVLAWTFKVENVPLLGLDLRGGVSVVLHPDAANGGAAIPDDSYETAIAIMNQRINVIGVAEPDIHRQGDDIVVQIAGVKNPDEAIKIVGETAELRFRPVMSAPRPDTSASTPSTTAPTETTVPGTAPGTTGAGAPGGTVAPTTAAQPASPPPPSIDATESASGLLPRQDPSTTVAPAATTTAPAVAPTTAIDPSATPVPTTPSTAASTPPATTAGVAPTTGPGGTTTRTDDKPELTVVLPGDPKGDTAGLVYQLGPVLLTGTALESASAGLSTQTGQWQVNPKFKPGADGIDLFNKAASLCFSKAPQCPTGQLAMTLDSKVISAPNIKVASFSADQIEISGSFNEDTARNLSTALNFGALPIVLTPLSSEIVSATLGNDALHAGLLAGFVGLILVAIYMIFFYRILGLLAVLKLAVEGALLWSFISYLGASAGLALTLAGITGIIVSIGVSLDSNVVYYEHLREDVRNGRTVRSAVDRSFASAFSTILKADGASLLGAFLLYWLAVGPVRGFAFYLGLSTVLDLISSYYYMRPIVFLATSSKLAREHPGWFGLPPSPEGVEPEPATRQRPSKAGKPAPVRDAARETKRDAKRGAANGDADTDDAAPADADATTGKS
jgi:preprotein translocase subunit SecD